MAKSCPTNKANVAFGGCMMIVTEPKPSAETMMAEQQSILRRKIAELEDDS